jgi:hypothetical protein
MDITGKVIFVSEPRSGVSKSSGNPWKSQDFVIETHDQYPRKCVFTVFGEDRLNQFNLQLNGEYTVSFDIDAHEFNGRWFNDIRAWRVVPAMAPAPQAVSTPPVQATSSVPQNDPLADANNDLPF